MTYVAMGKEAFFDVGGWNLLTWGNVSITGFLLVNRVVYLLGGFGEARVTKDGGKRD